MTPQRIFSLLWVLILLSGAAFALSLSSIHQKRQSDQRVAELETLLALHKYGGRKMGGRNAAGYGLIDFNYIGRKKKSQDLEDEDVPLMKQSSTKSSKLSSTFPWELSRSLDSVSDIENRRQAIQSLT